MDTRRRLLDAAITVLDRDGEAAIRVRDVSRAAGVSYASLYHFFGDREGMIEAAQAERYERSLFALMEPLREDIAQARSEKSFYDAVRLGVARMWTPERASFRRSRIEALAAMTARPGLAALIRDAQHTLNLTIAEMLKEPQRRGWVRRDLDLEMVGAWAQGMTNGRLLIEIDPERTTEMHGTGSPPRRWCSPCEVHANGSDAALPLRQRRTPAGGLARHANQSESGAQPSPSPRVGGTSPPECLTSASENARPSRP